jgi:hypothetical protein
MGDGRTVTDRGLNAQRRRPNFGREPGGTGVTPGEEMSNRGQGGRESPLGRRCVISHEGHDASQGRKAVAGGSGVGGLAMGHVGNAERVAL